ncbi:AAA family ATPase [Brucella sp. 10RB9214]|uniref:baseplate J/gp47 family protein n=1 Tax=Brucella sp. 10RB9214 TaxID=1844040 RepID=UPI0012ADFC9F|nr:baseplate J/gp47 family protein [Brucella sp. 10RB9214]MRN48685.1 AAA family ATPase [Brucella sp. 10RB9214]
MPWPVPSAKTIAERIASAMEFSISVVRPLVDPLAISRAVRSARGMLAMISRAVALEAREIHDHVAWWGRQYFVDTAEDEFVQRHADIYGIVARPATFAVGEVDIEGAAGTPIPADLEISGSDGTIFKTTETAIIGPNGGTAVSVIASVAGPAGNLEAGIRLRVYLRAKKEWSPSWFMNELLENLRVTPPHSFPKKYAKALEELAMRQNSAMLDRRAFGLVIDEADHISSKSSILETIRDISDMIELPTVLVGMGKVADHLARFPQVASRVSQRVSFQPASKDDVKALIAARCEVKVADDLIEFVLKVSQGLNREVLEAIANIERFGLRFDAGDEGVTLADMAGQVIMNNRHSNKPVMIPEVF